MKEFGGYLPLELREGHELFDRYPDANVARFNSGRAAIVAAAMAVRPERLFIPHYNCDVVREALSMYGIAYELYDLDRDFEPKLEGVGSSDWVLYVNYFGLCSEEKNAALTRRFKNVIFDNTQAFFAKPILDGNCMNVYSPRKFAGLVDGGYLVCSGDRFVDEDYPQDVSWERAGFLFKSIELGTNAAYQDNLCSKTCLADGIKRMSLLTRRMLCSLDYPYLAEKRDHNYRLLAKQLEGVNQLRFPTDGYAPFVYPLLVRKEGLRKRLVENRIYVPQWWKYLLDETPDDSMEADLSKWLLPLPVDQRYSDEDMLQMVEIVKACCRE